ncbi:helicase SKI2W, partial [Asbolus verrucosus]
GSYSVEPPPILPDITEELKNYLICPERLPIHRYERNQEFWPREPNLKELLHFEGSPLSTTLKVQRDPNTGEIIEFQEIPLQSPGANARNSMSLNRSPAPPSEATRGNASYIPFWPASFPDPVSQLPKQELLNSELLTIPPGFTRGIVFDSDGRTVLTNKKKSKGKNVVDSSSSVINLLEIIQQEQNFFGTFENAVVDKSEEISEKSRHETLPEEEEVLPNDPPILNISAVPPPTEFKSTEWAILLDTSKPVKDFQERIPEMAYEFPFELDTFQKLAILQLEQHNHIFVAAHTSAGKTVVAEYAIALSQKHMTRTIYTSPIKALSNQKYRDFKKGFKDVGLITGDFQINQTASCLIMTTEILRSMLYCGSDITRDLEYVIFDEVHYINDRERGHVWEQVLILLPPHVCVVLLSATVPNTIEFADWLGRTHQRKVYVITTYKRPVPLLHFLYTGTGGGSRDNRYLVLNSEGWKIDGYAKAVASLPKVDPKSAYPQAKSQYYSFTPKQEKVLWNGLVDHLKRNNLLPIVAFTFSRAKCDQNAENLMSLDLTTQKEKAQIHMFFEKCVRSLKEPDRNIPQILRMRNILHKGIGVHHSGVLPIIKEIVEMLFQNGLIKLLFATETFAMGVNMPARTVVFDSITKHDGQERRNLKPAEYIQMAGRAGRRRLDNEGTVIILCKNKIPKVEELQAMMMGSPNVLQSQFRLTYGMVLSLLRVERLSVEGMMSQSFREADHQKKMVDIQSELVEVEKQIEDLCAQELSSYLQPLVKFYECAASYLESRNKCQDNVMSSPKLIKVLTPGRILLITHKTHINKFALLLSVIRGKKPSYKVLVLTDAKVDAEKEQKNDLWYKMISLANENIFVPISSPGHTILTISAQDIFEIADKTVKIDTDLVIKDWEKRQIERFRNDPIGQTCQQAIQELHKITMSFNETTKNQERLFYLHFIHDLKVNEQKIHEELKIMYNIKDKLIDHLPSTQIPNFEQQFSSVFTRTFLERKREDLKHFLSSASLSLYPDYENRIELLRNLNYVDTQNRVQLKGRVACEMGMNELLITELVLRNILTKLQPAEVAALLSALVFSPKKDNKEEELVHITDDLTKAIREMQNIHYEIAKLEMNLDIKTDEFQNDLNFALVEIVYEWASAKPFADIMCLTDIQEGIIVRCIQQLNDTICDVRNAARIIGDPELQNKMEEASAAIKRDICVASTPANSNQQGDQDSDYSPIYFPSTQETNEDIDVLWDWHSPQTSHRRRKKQKRLLPVQSPKLPVKRHPSNTQTQNFEKLKDELRALKEELALPDDESCLCISPQQETEFKEGDGNNLVLKTEQGQLDHFDMFDDSIDEQLLLFSQQSICLKLH